MDLSRLFYHNHCNYDVKISYLHGRKASSISAFDSGEKIKILIETPRTLPIKEIVFLLKSDSGYLSSYSGDWVGDDGFYDSYIVELSSVSVGLYFYNVKIITGHNTYYLAHEDDRIYLVSKPSHAYDFQLSLSDFKYNPPEKFYGGVIYHIFVDRFYYKERAPLKDGAVYVDDWSSIPEYPEYPGAPLKNNTFYGGNLWGIIEKLRYIKSLGVNIIYLSPIFDAASNHKYDTGDYMSVDSMFGGDEALKELVKEAEKLGIRIILDGVFNHTGDDSIYFNRYGNYDSLGAYQSVDSTYYSWYNFEKHPDKYTCWWGIDILPRIHSEVLDCKEYFVSEGGVVDKYSRLGVGGFRLDVVDELSDGFIEDIKRVLAQNSPDSILYGEVWEDASSKIAYGKRKRYYLGSELDGVMNYPLRTGILEYIKHGNTEPLRYALTDIINNAPKRITDAQMNLLGSHDTPRILTAIVEDTDPSVPNSELAVRRLSLSDRDLAIARLKMAYTIIATLPGIPSIYYGDEAGLEGYSDPFNRMPYPWGSENLDLLTHYATLGRIRNNYEAYRTGEFVLNYLDTELLVFSRISKGRAYITVANNSNSHISLYTGKNGIRNLLGTDIITPLSCSVFCTNANDTIFISKLDI